MEPWKGTGDDRQQAQHQLGQAGRGLVLPALVDGQEADDQEVEAGRLGLSSAGRRSTRCASPCVRRSRTGTGPIVILSHQPCWSGTPRKSA